MVQIENTVAKTVRCLSPPREAKEPGLCVLDSGDACGQPLSLPFRLIIFSRVASGKRAQPKAHSPCVLRGDGLSAVCTGPQVSEAPHCLFGDRLQNFPTFIKLALVSPSHPHPCQRDQEQIHHSPHTPPHPQGIRPPHS